MVAVAQGLESQIVDLVVAGSNPVSHPILPNHGKFSAIRQQFCSPEGLLDERFSNLKTASETTFRQFLLCF